MDSTRFRGAFGPSRPRTRRAFPSHRTRANQPQRKDGLPARDGHTGAWVISAPEGLFLHVPWIPVSDDTLAAGLVGDVTAFAAVLREVWRLIALRARCALWAFWHDHAPAGSRTAPQRRPLIQLLGKEKLPMVAIHQGGHEVAFSADVITAPREHVRTVIARAFAEVYRIANGEHGLLLDGLLLTPLEHWEREHLKTCTDDEYDAIQDMLEKEFLRQHVTAVDDLLRGWKFLAGHDASTKPMAARRRESKVIVSGRMTGG